MLGILCYHTCATSTANNNDIKNSETEYYNKKEYGVQKQSDEVLCNKFSELFLDIENNILKKFENFKNKNQEMSLFGETGYNFLKTRMFWVQCLEVFWKTVNKIFEVIVSDFEKQILTSKNIDEKNCDQYFQIVERVGNIHDKFQQFILEINHLNEQTDLFKINYLLSVKKNFQDNPNLFKEKVLPLLNAADATIIKNTNDLSIITAALEKQKKECSNSFLEKFSLLVFSYICNFLNDICVSYCSSQDIEIKLKEILKSVTLFQVKDYKINKNQIQFIQNQLEKDSIGQANQNIREITWKLQLQELQFIDSILPIRSQINNGNKKQAIQGLNNLRKQKSGSYFAIIAVGTGVGGVTLLTKNDDSQHNKQN